MLGIKLIARGSRIPQGYRVLCYSRCLHQSSARTNAFAEASQSSIDSASTFIQEYKTRTQLESIIYHYASQPLPQFSLNKLYEQSSSLDPDTLLENAKETVDHLLVFNSRRLQQFRTLPYLVVLNPSISQSYNMYLKTMSLLIHSSLNLPATLEENQKFSELVLAEFIEIHMDSLPMLSKGFQEVSGFLGHKEIKKFLNEHLVERIRMRLIAHQHIQLSNALKKPDIYEKGGKYNGVIKNLNISDIIRKNAEHVNGLFFIKYDQTVPIVIDTNLEANKGFWSKEPVSENEVAASDVVFPYIDLHLDYILTELFKNAFRAHIENDITDPVQVTISVSRPNESSSYLEIRIRDKGKGIPKNIADHMFEYSFSTFDAGEGEGDSYKTLNVPPGLGGNTVAGMGYGLPLLKNYIEVFNETQAKTETKGLLTVQTYLGWGTDVYLKAVGK